MEGKKYSREGVLGKVAILNVAVSVGLIEKVTFEQTFEGEGMSNVIVQRTFQGEETVQRL